MILVSCLWLKGNWNPFGFYCVILILNLSCLISQMHFWFPKFDTFEFQSLSPAFDLPNDTFDFQNLSGLISQITLLISKIYRVWFLNYDTFWFPKFDFSNIKHFRFPKWDRYGWYSRDSSVGGKPYSRQGQGDTQGHILYFHWNTLSASFTTEGGRENVSVKIEDVPLIGYRVWVSSSLF